MEEFWRSLEAFAAYCFPKSHSSCYATIAYWTAYLKAHYPAAFMAALMTSDYDDTDRLAIEITECTHMGIQVLPPDVNESFVEFAVVPPVGAGGSGLDADRGEVEQQTEAHNAYGEEAAEASTKTSAKGSGSVGDSASKQATTAQPSRIRFGMAAIKNVGTGAVEEILRAREIDGKFEGLEDFLSKVNPRVVNRKTVESLIKAGAFDSLGERSTLINNIDVLLAYANRIQKEANSGQTDLFGAVDELAHHGRAELKLEASGEKYPLREQLQWERELLGLYLSQHPLQNYQTILEEQTVSLGSLRPEHHNRSVTIGGIIEDVREIITKSGQKMAFVKVTDGKDSLEIVLFPSVYQQTFGIWERDRVIIAKGKVTAQDRSGNSTNEIKVLADEAREVTHEQAEAYQATGKKPRVPKASKSASSASQKQAATPERVYIRLADSKDSELLLSLRQTITQHQGEHEVVLVLGPDDQKQVIKLPIKFAADDGSLDSLKELVGANNIKLQ
jgi:DNA polymerase-3 subunit alpha